MESVKKLKGSTTTEALKSSLNNDKWSRKLAQLPGDKKQTYESVEKRKVGEQRAALRPPE